MGEAIYGIMRTIMMCYQYRDGDLPLYNHDGPIIFRLYDIANLQGY